MVNQLPVITERAVNVQKLLVSAKEELLPLLKMLGDWQEAQPNDVQIEQISGAMTNLIFRCRYKDKPVLARIFGTSGVLFERDTEQQIFEAVAHAGLGPQLLMKFGNGRLEEFLLDQSISAQQMQTPPIAVCVAAAMAMFNFTQLNRLPVPRNNRPICWDRMRCWSKAMKQQYTQAELAAEGLDNVDELISGLERKLKAKGPTWMGFCHNDTQYGNLLLHTASDATLEAQADAEDLLDTRSSLEELPEGEVVQQISRLRFPLGSSPPSVSSMMQQVETMREASLRQSQSAQDDGHAIEKADGLEEREASSPRKQPRGSPMLEERQPSSHESTELDCPLNPRQSVRFIDYEYAGYNPVAMDIANHWCEYAADYHTSQPHKLDYSKFPKDKQQKVFIRAYVHAVITLKRHKEEMGLPARADSLSHSLAVSAAISGSLLESDLCALENFDCISQQVQEAAQAYVPVAHLSWGIWGFLQARLSDVPSFDFTEYGRQRLQQYRLTSELAHADYLKQAGRR